MLVYIQVARLRLANTSTRHNRLNKQKGVKHPQNRLKKTYQKREENKAEEKGAQAESLANRPFFFRHFLFFFNSCFVVNGDRGRFFVSKISKRALYFMGRLASELFSPDLTLASRHRSWSKMRTQFKTQAFWVCRFTVPLLGSNQFGFKGKIDWYSASKSLVDL